MGWPWCFSCVCSICTYTVRSSSVLDILLISNKDHLILSGVGDKTISVLRDSKKAFFDKITDKSKSESFFSKDWWSTLKSTIDQNTKLQIPPLESNGLIYTDEKEKANHLDHFIKAKQC